MTAMCYYYRGREDGVIVNHLSRLLGERRMSVAALSRATGIPRSSLHEIYHDKALRIDVRTLDRLCKYLRVTVCELLEYQEEE
jgi:putative transcriptional regulator